MGFSSRKILVFQGFLIDSKLLARLQGAQIKIID